MNLRDGLNQGDRNHEYRSLMRAVAKARGNTELAKTNAAKLYGSSFEHLPAPVQSAVLSLLKEAR